MPILYNFEPHTLSRDPRAVSALSHDVTDSGMVSPLGQSPPLVHWGPSFGLSWRGYQIPLPP